MAWPVAAALQGSGNGRSPCCCPLPLSPFAAGPGGPAGTAGGAGAPDGRDPGRPGAVALSRLSAIARLQLCCSGSSSGSACPQTAGLRARPHGPGQLQAVSAAWTCSICRPHPAAPLNHPSTAPAAGARGAPGAQGTVRRGRGARAPHAGLVRCCCAAALRRAGLRWAVQTWCCEALQACSVAAAAAVHGAEPQPPQPPQLHSLPPCTAPPSSPTPAR